MPEPELKNQIRRLRFDHGEMTQEQLAELIGISPGYLSQVETPAFVQPVSLKTLFAIANLFHIPPAKFLEFDE
jgi:transcriptional regulator with XRE-family HTH domain